MIGGSFLTSHRARRLSELIGAQVAVVEKLCSVKGDDLSESIQHVPT